MSLAYLGLGSNLGDRRANLQAALDWLVESGSARVLRVSPLYETQPFGPQDQPWFLNGVAEVQTDLSPESLRDSAKEAESAVGRTVGTRWGARVIDVDILLYDALRMHTELLTIPHRELWRRLFVLAPLRDLRPDLRAPDGAPIGEWIDRLSDPHRVCLSTLTIESSAEPESLAQRAAAQGAGRRNNAH